MKKLVVIAFAIMLGVVANAAAVTWSVTNVQSSPAATVEAGWLVQLFDASVAYDYAKVLSGDIAATFTGSTIVQSATAFKATQKETDAASAGDTVSLYMVIYDAATAADASYYIVSDVSSKTVAASGADITVAFGSMSSTATANKFLSSSWTATAVPEPTSGLLMLLGMAGLALRRRRA